MLKSFCSVLFARSLPSSAKLIGWPESGKVCLFPHASLPCHGLSSLCCSALLCSASHCSRDSCSVLFSAVLHCSLLFCILFSAVLHIVLCCSVLFYAVLHIVPSAAMLRCFTLLQAPLFRICPYVIFHIKYIRTSVCPYLFYIQTLCSSAWLCFVYFSSQSVTMRSFKMEPAAGPHCVYMTHACAVATATGLF